MKPGGSIPGSQSKQQLV